VVVLDVEETGRQYVATAGYDGLVGIWEAKKGTEQTVLAWELRAEHKFDASVLGLAVRLHSPAHSVIS
jgi:hypothetical protein